MLQAQSAMLLVYRWVEWRDFRAVGRIRVLQLAP